MEVRPLYVEALPTTYQEEWVMRLIDYALTAKEQINISALQKAGVWPIPPSYPFPGHLKLITEVLNARDERLREIYPSLT